VARVGVRQQRFDAQPRVVQRVAGRHDDRRHRRQRARRRRAGVAPVVVVAVREGDAGLDPGADGAVLLRQHAASRRHHEVGARALQPGRRQQHLVVGRGHFLATRVGVGIVLGRAQARHHALGAVHAQPAARGQAQAQVQAGGFTLGHRLGASELAPESFVEAADGEERRSAHQQRLAGQSLYRQRAQRASRIGRTTGLQAAAGDARTSRRFPAEHRQPRVVDAPVLQDDLAGGRPHQRVLLHRVDQGVRPVRAQHHAGVQEHHVAAARGAGAPVARRGPAARGVVADQPQVRIVGQSGQKLGGAVGRTLIDHDDLVRGRRRLVTERQ